MKQLNPGKSYGFSTVLKNSAGTIKRKTSRLSKTILGGAFAMLFAFNADATHINVTSFAPVNAGVPTNTSSCVAGAFTNNWMSGTGYWDYTVNTVGFSNITMTYKNQKSAAAGPTSGSVWYNNGLPGALDTLISGSSFVPSTSCPSGFTVLNLPANCNGYANLHIKVKMTGATANTATHRITSDPFDGTTSACSTVAAGSISGTNTICAGTSTNLTLSGATSGGGVTYQWQFSNTGSAPWSNIGGATNQTYTTVNLSANTSYRVMVTCPTSGAKDSTSAYAITVNSIAFGPITGLSSTTMLVNATATLGTTPTGGTWQSSNTSRATIDVTTGAVLAKKGGAVTFTYSTIDGTTGCTGTTDTTVNIVWPNTLALYVGDNGNSTNVYVDNGATVSAVTATGFGTATGCTSGGVSGLTVPTSVTSFNAANPHVGFTITPTAGNALNAFRIHAITRESGTGPTKAVIAYSVNGGAWVAEPVAFTQSTGGSCGAASNEWDFTPSFTEMGITGTLEVAVFPYSPSASTGTFQLNQLEVYGIISDNVACSGLSHPGALEAPTKWIICDSGSRWMNYDGAGAGVGVTLTWQKAVGTAGSFSDISPVVNTASYNTGVLHASTPADTFTRYRVRVHCIGSGADAFSAPDTIIVHARPTAGTISGIPSYLHRGQTVTLSSVGATGSTIFWRSNDTSAIAIDSASGQMTGRIPGFAYITKVVTSDNVCFSSVKDSARNVLPNTVVAYIGKFGTSTGVDVSADATVGNLTQANFGTPVSACGFGGLSGLTMPLTVNSYNSATGPYISALITPSAAMTINSINATVRRSSNGAGFFRIAYRVNGGAWIDNGTDLEIVNADDCGYSDSNYSFPVSVSLDPIFGDVIETAVFPFAPLAANGAFQLNTMVVTTSTGGVAVLRKAGVANVTKAGTIKLYPNPATSVLNVEATEAVNVTVLSIDGKKLIEQKNATSINISSLASGMYLIQVSDVNNNLIETAKFTKQ